MLQTIVTICFFVAFCIIAICAFLPGSKRKMDDHSKIPFLDEDGKPDKEEKSDK